MGWWCLGGIVGGVVVRGFLGWRGLELGGFGLMRWRLVVSCVGACGSSFLILPLWFFLLFHGCRFGVLVLSSGW